NRRPRLLKLLHRALSQHQPLLNLPSLGVQFRARLIERLLRLNWIEVARLHAVGHVTELLLHFRTRNALSGAWVNDVQTPICNGIVQAIPNVDAREIHRILLHACVDVAPELLDVARVELARNRASLLHHLLVVLLELIEFILPRLLARKNGAVQTDRAAVVLDLRRDLTDQVASLLLCGRLGLFLPELELRFLERLFVGGLLALRAVTLELELGSLHEALRAHAQGVG